MTVEAWNHDKTEKLATGTFLTMDTMIDTATGTVRVKAIFDNEDLMLFPNQFVNAKLVIETLTNVTLIPTTAIQHSPQGAFVYVVTNQVMTLTNETGTVVTNRTVVAMRAITPGVANDSATSVQGLQPGEVIAADNFNKLGEGMKVNLRQPAGQGRKEGAPDNGKHRQNKGQAEPDAS